jgi:hypothetical protein
MAERKPAKKGTQQSAKRIIGKARGVHKYDLAANRVDPVDDRFVHPTGVKTGCAH